MQQKTVETYWVRIYLSGPIEVAKQTIREECLNVGLCVTIEPTVFIFTGGEESGYVIGLVNYPRFPMENKDLLLLARRLMSKVLNSTFQHSAMLMTPEITEWVSKREK